MGGAVKMALLQEELLRKKIQVLKNAGSTTDEYEAELARLSELAKRYPLVLELSDLKWIIDGVLAERGITIIGGLTDTGKTTLALQLCGCLLEKKLFLGMEVRVRINSIAYACLDQSTGMLRDQVVKMLPTFPSLAQIRVIPDIVWDGKEIKGLAEAVQSLQSQVMVVDALNALLGTADENIAMGPIMREFRRAAENHGISLIIPHQFRKLPLNGLGRTEPTAQDFRGSTEIGAKPEVLLALQRRGFEVKMTSVKAKSANKVELNLRQDPKTLVYSLCVTKQERMRQLLQEGIEPKDVTDTVHQEYGGNWNSIKTMVYRERDNIQDSGNNA